MRAMRSSDGLRGPSRCQWWADRIAFIGRRLLVRDICVQVEGSRYFFRCESETEVRRAMTLLSKEPGTMRWIASEVLPGETFLDIGANIGLYSLVAAQRVGPTGRVYSFEPHPANFLSLVQNIRMNGMGRRIRALSCALNDRPGAFDFNYQSFAAGSSISQLDGCLDDEGKPFVPAYSELKLATTLDALVEQGAVEAPHHVKIDVDGNELLILRGMARLLSSPRPPKTVQVEINIPVREQVLALMREAGFELSERHYSSGGKRAVEGGRDPDITPHNAIFKPSRLAK